MEHHPPEVTPEGDSIAWFERVFSAAEAEIARVVLGQDEVVRGVLVALVAGGHVLLEGPPGLGKTLLARTLSKVLGARFSRVQFTPDLMPSDVTGGNVFNEKEHRFEFHAGPVFTQILLADEINRAPAKTQSALLEAMSDRQVTVDGVSRALPTPFFTIATQNPVESEGTYPLPEAQLDRFLFKLLVAHVSRDVEIDLLRHSLAGFDAADLDAVGLKTVLSAEEVGRLRAVAKAVRVDPEILGYVVDLVGRTRQHPAVELGASPRATLSLLACAQVTAAAEGRSYVVPDDVKGLALPVLRHRVILQPDAELEGVDADRLVRAILDDVPVPGGERS